MRRVTASEFMSLDKHVVSTTLEGPPRVEQFDADQGERRGEVLELKSLPGQDILIFGSADIVNALMRHDLIDEYRLMVFPVIVGKGKQLFGDGIDTKVLELVGTEMFVSGVVVLTYRPAGMETEG